MNSILLFFSPRGFFPISGSMSYTTLLKRGTRIALRSKVNDSLLTGIRIVDSLLPIGRGQRQLILGDRYTGKTSLFLSSLFIANMSNSIGSIEGFGAKRCFGLYVGIQINLSKLCIMTTLLRKNGLD
jgi:F-type H+-transporting ATPase subunit alpha